MLMGLRRDAVALARGVRLCRAQVRDHRWPVGSRHGRGWAVHLWEGGVPDRGNAQARQMQGLQRGVRLQEMGMRRIRGRCARMRPMKGRGVRRRGGTRIWRVPDRVVRGSCGRWVTGRQMRRRQTRCTRVVRRWRQTCRRCSQQGGRQRRVRVHRVRPRHRHPLPFVLHAAILEPDLQLETRDDPNVRWISTWTLSPASIFNPLQF